MKIVSINNWQRALAIRNNRLVGVLTEGTHIVRSFTNVVKQNMTERITPPINLDILLKDKEFVNATLLVEVKNNELGMQYENGLFKAVLLPGRYVFWKGLVDYRFIISDLNQVDIDPSIDRSLLATKELAGFVKSYTIEPFEKAVMYVDGKFLKIAEPGTYYFWKNTTIVVSRADMRTVQMEIAGQEILTKDKAALRINFYVQYAIQDIVKALVNNKEHDKQLYVVMQMAVREFVGAFTLDELLEKKELVSTYILGSVEARTKEIGVSIKNSGIRDIILPGDMKDIMNQVLIAEKKAQSNTIMRREETASTRSLLNTAKLMEDNAMLLRLKEMEYLEKIAEKINHLSLSGGTQLTDQLKHLFVPQR